MCRTRSLLLRFGSLHGWIVFVLWLVFSGLTLHALLRELDDAADRPLTVAATVVGTALGPMTGAISRNFESSCLDFSIALLPYCLSGLCAACLVQVVTSPDRLWVQAARLIAWTAGLGIWFGGGILSLGYALS